MKLTASGKACPLIQNSRYLYCDDGKSIAFGEWTPDFDGIGGGPMLSFKFKVRSDWCEMIGSTADSLKRFCENLEALTSRTKASMEFHAMYGNLSLEFIEDRRGNYLVKGEFAPSLEHNGELTEEFQTHEAAIVTFRQGIEAALAEAEF